MTAMTATIACLLEISSATLGGLVVGCLATVGAARLLRDRHER